MPTRGLRSRAQQRTKRQAVTAPTRRPHPEAARRPGTRADAVSTIIDPQSTGMAARAADADRRKEAGVPKAAVIDGRDEHSLLFELFTTSGSGTEVTA